MPTLYLMLGYPGAGKTTTAKVIADITGATLLSSDALRFEMFDSPRFSEEEHEQLYRELNQRTEKLLASGKDVVYDANLNRHEHRREKYDICEQANATPKLIWVRTPKELAKQRATHESRKHFTPRGEALADMFDRIANLIEEPKQDEHHIEIIGQNVTPEIVRAKLGL